MTFLLGQIASCLLLAFLAGFLLGWVVRDYSKDSHHSATAAGYADGYTQVVGGHSLATDTRPGYARSRIPTVLGEVE